MATATTTSASKSVNGEQVARQRDLRANVASLKRLAIRYQNGEGVKKDYRLALRLWRAAAEDGDAEAQFSVGAFLEAGVGARKDPKQAAEWYKKAAEQGNADGQYSLGVCYREEWA